MHVADYCFRNCREKKIKCEPGETSCVQCEKAKRECHR